MNDHDSCVNPWLRWDSSSTGRYIIRTILCWLLHLHTRAYISPLAFRESDKIGYSWPWRRSCGTLQLVGWRCRLYWFHPHSNANVFHELVPHAHVVVHRLVHPCMSTRSCASPASTVDFYLADFRCITTLSWGDYFSIGALKFNRNLLALSFRIAILSRHVVKSATRKRCAAMTNFAVVNIEVAYSIFSTGVLYADYSYDWSSITTVMLLW